MTNAAVLTVAVLILAFSPATVSNPLSLLEAAVLVSGLAVLVVVNLALFRRAFTPLLRLTEAMGRVDLLEPGGRVPVYGDDAEVAELTSAFNEMLDRLEGERRQSARAALSAQEDERSRVARELHDEIGQSLTALVLELDMLGRRAGGPVKGGLENAREEARTTLEEVRRVAQRLRPEALDELGLETALSALAARVGAQAGLRVHRRLDRRLPPLSPEAELVIYRIAQESLTNALRHANATNASVTLTVDAESVTLVVRDDGRGLAGAEPGAGIQGMRERALLARATLTLSTQEEGGTEVKLEVPVEA